jgi:hypothetical protein
MEEFTVNDAYPPLLLGDDILPVVNRTNLSSDDGGFYVTLDVSDRASGDQIHLYWDGERVATKTVGWWWNSMDFGVPPQVLERHPGTIAVYYVVQPVGTDTTEGASRSPTLTLDAKFTRPGGDDPSPTETPYVNEGLARIEGTDALAKGKDLVLSIPAWKNMEAGAQTTVHWGGEDIELDPATIMVGQPVEAVVPWSIIDRAPKGMVAVTYSIRDRVGNDSGKAPPVELAVVFADLLPMPSFEAVNAYGQLDTRLALARAATTDETMQTPLIVEYPDVRTGDEITLTLQGMTATGLAVVPYQASQFAGPGAELDDDEDGAARLGANANGTDADASPMKRYSFDVPIVWLSLLVGGSILAGYVVKRGDIDLESATRARAVVGDALLLPAPELPQAAGGVFDLALVKDTIIRATLAVDPAWPRHLTAFLRVRSDPEEARFERSLAVGLTDDDDLLVWSLERDVFAEFPEGDIVLSVNFKDDDGNTVYSAERRVRLRRTTIELAWPGLFVPQASAGGELSSDLLKGGAARVVVPTNGLFQDGDEVTVLWQDAKAGSAIFKRGGAEVLTYDVPNADVVRCAGKSVLVTYIVTRNGVVVGPQPTVVLTLRIAAATIAQLPAPSATGSAEGALDIEQAKNGVVLTIPAGADLRDSDTIVFEIKAADGTWHGPGASQGGNTRTVSVSGAELIPSLGGSFEARYLVTRDGLTKTSDSLVLSMKAYLKNDPRLPKPYIREAQAKPGGEGNPFVDMKKPLPKALAVVVPPWPFMRPGQQVTVTVRGFFGKRVSPTALELAKRREVLQGHLDNGMSLELPREWLLSQPKVADTDIQIEVSIERPLAGAGFRYMTLPVAVVNLVNLDELDKGGALSPGEITDSKPRLSDVPSIYLVEATPGGALAGQVAPDVLLLDAVPQGATIVLTPWNGMKAGDQWNVSPYGQKYGGGAWQPGMMFFEVKPADVGSEMRRTLPRTDLLELLGSGKRAPFTIFGSLAGGDKRIEKPFVLIRGAGAGGSGGGMGSTGSTGSTGGTGGAGGTGGTGGSGSGGGGTGGPGSGNGSDGGDNDWPRGKVLDLVKNRRTGIMDFGGLENSVLRNASAGPEYERGRVMDSASASNVPGYPTFRYPMHPGIVLYFDVLLVPGSAYVFSVVEFEKLKAPYGPGERPLLRLHVSGARAPVSFKTYPVANSYTRFSTQFVSRTREARVGLEMDVTARRASELRLALAYITIGEAGANSGPVIYTNRK